MTLTDYYDIRYYDSETSIWLSVDPLLDLFLHQSSYTYCSNNPVNRIDPNGMWDDWVEAANGRIYWDENATSQATTKEGEIYLGKAFVHFKGKENEQLGDGGNLYGKGAILADITVYGPGGENDIANYKGYTMSSDPNFFGVVVEGDYTVNRLGANEPPGPYNSDLVIEHRNAQIPAKNGVNPAFPNRKPGYLTGVFIHRSNNNGFAGTFVNKNGKYSGVSQGCPLIAPKDWNAFVNQLKSVNSFRLRISR